MDNNLAKQEKVKITLLGHLFRLISKNWNELRLFSFHTRTLFEIFFVLVYTIEQGILIYWGATNKLNLTRVSCFALLVLFTFALHKIIMESRMKILEHEIIELKNENDFIHIKSEQMATDYNEIIGAYEEVVKDKIKK
ncbi:MAG: hypothetical protein KKC75_07040 [Nanoarchaeota archaeon]|nr:hypothetical protein [Nanoarchaeota archaeon]MBU1005312.1 hypothetical protein [Nanoarchaeota archaeon]MBU1946940.1 hypothetical protein [Nanoarchaeota archaeon]